MNYIDFLRSKIEIAKDTGFCISPNDVNPALKPHQKDAVVWAVKGGKRALFESFGLGKTCQELEFCRIVTERVGGKAIIVLPLGVKQEFTNDAVNLLGWTDMPEYVRTMADVRAAAGNVLITNYERVRDGDIDPRYFTATSLDEASVLRSFGSKTYQTFLDKFKGVPYKLVATATPSPNRYKELIHYAGYLEIQDTGQSLTMWFQRDSTKANKLTLYPHKENEFWLWVSSWALFITKPSDLGYDDTGYIMPPLDIRYHEVPVDHATAGEEKDGQGKLFRDAAAGLKDAAKEKRDSINSRVDKMVEIINKHPDDHFIIWHDLEAERHAIKRAVPSVVDIYGSQDLDIREQRVIDFSNGKVKYFATKKELSGSGCNFQRHCHRAIFLGIDYKFNDFIQAIHRIYRFLQTEQVRIDIIHTESERNILDALLKKWEQHDYMVKKMIGVVKRYGLNNTSMIDKLARSIGVERVKITGKHFTVVNNDCVLETTEMASDSVDLIHTSIPFCYDEQTEILTRRGWLSFEHLKVNEDEVATVDVDGRFEWQIPSHVIWEHYEGEMVSFKGQSFNLNVTPNHRMYVARRGLDFGPDKFHIVTADKITREYEAAPRTTSSERLLRGWRVCVVPPKRGEGVRPDHISIPLLPDHICNGHGVQLYWIETEDFMRLAGWYLSEGHADSFDTGRSGGRLSIGQSPQVNAEKYKEIENLMIRIGLPPSHGKNQITVWCRNLAYFMQKEFGHGAENKRIPRWVLDFHPDLLEILRDTMIKGDGSKYGDSYASISPELRDAFQEICLKTGWRATLNGTKVVNIGSTRLFPEIRKVPKRVRYSGMIGCATVPNGTLIVRRNGQPCISGNSNHYEYTPSYNDFGHNQDNNRFFEQMDYLTPELLRVLKPGRVAAIHVKDRILFGNATGTGMPTVDPFSDITVFHFIKHGFQYMGRITVVTDVVRENNQTYRLGWTEQCKDGSKMGVGCPEYILLFRKLPSDTSTAYADVPVSKSKKEYTRAQWQIDAHAFWRSSGDRFLSKDELASIPVSRLQAVYRRYSRGKTYDYAEHVELAKKLDKKGRLPASFMVVAPGSWNDCVWDDINRMKTLNTNQRQKDLQMHVCLARGSLVLTKTGFKPIESIELGDMVLTHKGNWKPVIAKKCTGVNPVIQTKAQGVPNLITTPDHKLWMRKTDKVRAKDYLPKTPPAWIEAQDIKGAWVNLKLPDVEHSNLSNVEWWVVGRYLADGHRGIRGDFFISVGRDKKEEFETMAAPYIGTVAKHEALQYRLKNVSEALKDMLCKCGQGAANKQVPIEGVCLAQEKAGFLLDGYLSGDGNKTGNATSASSVSRALLLGMAMVAQRARGVIASVFGSKPAGKHIIQEREVNQRQLWVMSWRDSSHHRHGAILNDGAWKKVSVIEEKGTAETWSIQVAGDASFTAEGCIVKNCPLQIDIVERIINRYSNHGEVVFDPFGGLMTVPMTAIKMGRYGYGIELNTDYFRDGVGYCQAAESKVSMPTLFDFLPEERRGCGKDEVVSSL